MTSLMVTIVDYGMGNIWSVAGAIRYLGGEAVVSSDPDKISKSDCLILPGVGSFRQAMKVLSETGIKTAIEECVLTKGSKILGICLGMQLLGSQGTEDGETAGLGLIENRVDKFETSPEHYLKIPHIGFNSTVISECHGLFESLSSNVDFYYVHSYRMLPENLSGRIATCRYGIEFLAAFELGNIYGTQFHPEKSQTNGLVLLKNFLEL